MDAGDREPDSTADGADGARWMSFAELGAARGISKASAIKLVRRHGWRRQRDNQGHVRALVPLTWAQDDRDEEGDNIQDSTPDNPPDTGLMAGALAALETAVLSLTERAVSAERRADSALSLAEGTMAQLAEANARAHRAEGSVSAIQTGLDVARAEARAARERAEALEREAAARQARGLLARLRAAVRGR